MSQYGSVYDLAFNGQQAITWSNDIDDPIQWHIYASPGLKVLQQQMMLLDDNQAPELAFEG